MAEGLAVDWLSNNIYWSDSLYNWIIMSPRNSVEPVFKTIVRTGLSSPHSLAVHPQKGYNCLLLTSSYVLSLPRITCFCFHIKTMKW